MTEAPPVFNRTRRVLHWSIAVLLLAQVPLAWYMVELPLGPAKAENYGLHKSIGMVLFTLGTLRVITALLTRRPGLPAGMPVYQRWLARGIEFLLFVVIVLMPVTGWLMSSAANFPVVVFGLLPLPDLIAPNEALFEKLRDGHRLQSYVLLTLVTVHFFAAIRHHFVLRDNVLYSMAPVKWLRQK